MHQTEVENMLQYSKVLGAMPPADLMTKYSTAGINANTCARLDMHLADGRAKSAPTLSNSFEAKSYLGVGR